MKAAKKETECLAQLVRSGISAEAFNLFRAKTNSNSVATRLFDFWRLLVIHGDEFVKEKVSKSSFYRNKQELEAINIDWKNAASRASALLECGDESIFRANDSRRYVVECLGGKLSDMHSSPQHRKRKFSNPLFIAPHGLLSAFPENDDDLFISLDSAQLATKKFADDADAVWSTSSTTLKQQLKSKPYLRWLKEVKPLNGEFKESRRTLEDKAEIFRNGGLDGLKAKYTKSHAFHTMAQLQKADAIS